MIEIKEHPHRAGTVWDYALKTRIIYEIEYSDRGNYVHHSCAEEHSPGTNHYESARMSDEDDDTIDRYNRKSCAICGEQFHTEVLDYIPASKPEPNPFEQHFLS